jgi:hypothetical protein
VKLIIEPGDFPGIRQALEVLGVNASELFTYLDGLVAYLSWHYTKLKDEE